MRSARSVVIVSFGLLAACATAASPPGSPASTSRDGEQPLFNGRDLSGWEGDIRYWSVQEGAITGETTEATRTKTPTYLVWRGGILEDFELRVVYRLVGPGNSGVQYRSQELPDFLVHGYQADFETDHGQKWTAALVDMGGRLHLGRRGQKTVVGPDGKVQIVEQLGDPEALKAHLRADDWNEYVVLARGNRLVHKINGHTMLEVTDNQTDKRASSGILALQLSRSKPMKVQFRAVELKRAAAIK